MNGKGRYGRPDRTSLLAMMVINGVLAAVVMSVTLAMFGVHDILPAALATRFHMQLSVPWPLVWPMVPGAAIAFGCFRYWLIVIGRSRGVPWGGAAVYGLIIGLVNVPLGGFIYGLMQGKPLFGMLIMLVLLLIVPIWLLAVSIFGIAMGVLNAWAAQAWITRNRR